MNVSANLNKDIIKYNPYFRSLSDKACSKLIQQVSVIKLPRDEILFHEGDFADAFYIVKEGAIQITTINAQGKTIFLARISEEGFFGEQAFSQSISPRRNASAKARSDSILYKFPRDALLPLHHADQQLQKVLQKQNLAYLREKLNKLANSIGKSLSNIKKMMANEKRYPKDSIIFFQNEPAKQAYILVYGEIELHHYNENKQLQQIIEINPGRIFGAEGLHLKGNKYNYTAVVKQKANVIVVDVSQYNKTADQHPLLKQFYTNFDRQLDFKTKGKIVQFRSEYLEMPSMTSLILLDNGQEIVCQQIIGADIFSTTVLNRPSTRSVKYTRDKRYSRELFLADNKIVGLLDYGLWENSYDFLDFMIDDRLLTEEQLNEFTKNGYITVEPSEATEEDDLVCKCMRVPYNVINKLIASRKTSFDEISQQTGAGTVCGGCKPTILEMLGMNVWIPCTVLQIIEHNPNVKSFRLKPTEQDISAFKPGQYLILKTKIDNEWIQRSYTLTSTPGESYFEITVKKESKGIFSPWLFSQTNKDFIVYASGPYGNFIFEDSAQSPIVCFMGGIGITPAIAFLRYIIKTKSERQIYIDYSAYYANQFILREEFDTFTEKYNNVTINYRITDVNGPISKEEVQKIISSIDGCHVYTCGPEGFEKLITQTFNQMNLSPERFHVEKFVHAGAPEDIAQTINFE